MASLSFTSIISIICSTFIIFTIVFESPNESKLNYGNNNNSSNIVLNIDNGFQINKVLASVGSIAYAFGCQTLTISTYHSIKKEHQIYWNWVTHSAIFMVVLFYGLAASFGYIYFGNQTQGLIFFITHTSFYNMCACLPCLSVFAFVCVCV